MFDAVLVANRGEIARRILRTCREMGLRGIAVYSDADRDLPFVAEADLALRLGPAPAAESYLNIERILALALGNGAGAVHPGYGFLSESPAFAEACAARGLTFVGAPAAAIRLMGDKSAARRAVAAAGVPTVPGYDGGEQSGDALRHEAERVGYPLFVKAAAGGGGRGIRLVHQPDELPGALVSARREAENAFGDGTLLLERALLGARHIEVQVLADRHGSVVALGERDCSLQRRHQKVLEETPAPGLDAGLREALTTAAVQAARAAEYEGAGTVEFLVRGAEHYFLEMNTRLQVEHPVTEMVWGVDLVRLQLEIAAGQALPPDLGGAGPRGHAVECRLIAEDPQADFLPAVGPLLGLHLPEGPGRRIDAGYAAGTAVSSWYDSLLAKLCTWGADRAEALRRMQRLLAESHVAGVASNLALLQDLLALPEVQAGGPPTDFLPQALGAGRLAPAPDEAAQREALLAAAALDAWLAHSARQIPAAEGSPAPLEAPTALEPLRGRERRRYRLGDAGEVPPQELSLSWQDAPGGLRVWATTPLGTEEMELRGAPGENPGAGTAHLELAGALLPLRWTAAPEAFWLTLRGRPWRVERRTPAGEPGAAEEATADGTLRAPLPGRVLEVAVQPGADVPAGALLLVMEAMKVEHRFTAPWAARVGTVHCRAGGPVARGEALLVLERQEA